MSPFDSRLTLMAHKARVKTCHIFHLLMAVQEMGDKFHAEAFALFTGLEMHHVEQMLSTLQEHGLPERKTRQQSARGQRLPNDWTIPPEWSDWATQERRWHPADVREESEIFSNYWQSRSGIGACKLDWRKVWMNWVRNSRRQNGDYQPQHAKQSPEDRADFLRKKIDLYRKLCRDSEIPEMQRELDRLESNIIPFERGMSRPGYK